MDLTKGDSITAPILIITLLLVFMRGIGAGLCACQAVDGYDSLPARSRNAAQVR